jgi:hypothetical protein
MIVSRGLGRARGLGDDGSTIDLGLPTDYTGVSIQDYLSQAASAGLSPGPVTSGWPANSTVSTTPLSSASSSSVLLIAAAAVGFVLLLAVVKK